MRRRTAWACALALAASAPAAPAQAHTALRASSPADGAVLRAAPRAVALTFSSPPGRVESVAVRAGGADVAGAARRDPRDARRVTVPLRGEATGPYRVAWAVRAADGDVVGGALSFRVAAPPVGPAVRALGAAIARAAREVGTVTSARR